MDVDIPAFGFIFCLMMIVVGQFFLMNLILAVIIFAFIKTQKQELEDEILALHGDEVKPDRLMTLNSTVHNGESFVSKNGGGGGGGDKTLQSKMSITDS